MPVTASDLQGQVDVAAGRFGQDSPDSEGAREGAKLRLIRHGDEDIGRLAAKVPAARYAADFTVVALASTAAAEIQRAELLLKTCEKAQKLRVHPLKPAASAAKPPPLTRGKVFAGDHEVFRGRNFKRDSRLPAQKAQHHRDENFSDSQSPGTHLLSRFIFTSPLRETFISIPLQRKNYN